MSRYTCHNCKAEHGTDNMVAYCAACYSDARSEFTSLREVNIQLAKDAAAEKDRAEKANESALWEKRARRALEVLKKAIVRFRSAESQVDALTKERDALIRSTGEHITVRSEYQEKVAALTEKLEDAKRLTAPHLQEYALRLEEENKNLTERLAAEAAKQAELVEALREVDERCPEGFDGQDSWTNEAHRKVRAILARYPKAVKEDA